MPRPCDCDYYESYIFVKAINYCWWRIYVRIRILPLPKLTQGWIAQKQLSLYQLACSVVVYGFWRTSNCLSFELSKNKSAPKILIYHVK